MWQTTCPLWFLAINNMYYHVLLYITMAPRNNLRGWLVWVELHLPQNQVLGRN